MTTDEFKTLSHHPLLTRAYELTIGAPPGDAELEDIFHPDVVIDFSERVLAPRVYEGFEGVRKLLADLHSSLDEFKFEVEEVRESGDALVAFVHTRGRIPASGEAVSVMAAHSWTVRDGLIAAGRYFAERDDALAPG